jgi:DNA polymerase I
MLDPFREIVAVDFEFTAAPGNRPEPVCLVAYELRSGRPFRLWLDQSGLRPPDPLGSIPPYATGPDVLFVAYFCSGDLGCYRALGWKMPERILDPYVEFRNLTNGLHKPAGAGLLGASIYFGLDVMDAVEKKEMQEAIGDGTWQGHYTPEEILAYCEQDVAALSRLLPRMLPQIDLSRALLRGRYMAAVSAIEYAGTPIDTDTLARLRHGWTGIQDQLVAAIDKDYVVYKGRTFKHELFETWLVAHGIPWPRLESGRLDLSDEAFRQQAKVFPIVSPLRELRSALSDLRLNDLAVGKDARNRCLLSPFGARSSRNTPSNTKYIFGPSVWLRGLIKPPPGHGIAYVDWAQQEIGIAGALSQDPALIAAYESGDVYLAFAKQARAIPVDATEKTHPAQRELFKQCSLAVIFGQGEDGLAQRIGQSRAVARELLQYHHQTYKVFWRWSDAAVDTAMLNGSLHTVFGWHVHLGGEPNPRSLRNFPMQGNGAEMMRLAACLATERGIEVCAPVHDAFLICATLDRLDEDKSKMQAAMTEASRIVLGGFELRTECKDAEVVRYPNRYMDSRGRVMWQRVMALLNQAEKKTA